MIERKPLQGLTGNTKLAESVWQKVVANAENYNNHK